MTDVQAPEAPERFFQGLTNLRIFCKFISFFSIWPNLAESFCHIFLNMASTLGSGTIVKFIV